jgi:hypothetical protein
MISTASEEKKIGECRLGGGQQHVGQGRNDPEFARTFLKTFK